MQVPSSLPRRWGAASPAARSCRTCRPSRQPYGRGQGHRTLRRTSKAIDCTCSQSCDKMASFPALAIRGAGLHRIGSASTGVNIGLESCGSETVYVYSLMALPPPSRSAAGGRCFLRPGRETNPQDMVRPWQWRRRALQIQSSRRGRLRYVRLGYTK